jgi:hypothetical protein
MALDSWLAGIGGALGGFEHQRADDEKMALEEKRLEATNELRLMLEQLRQSGQTSRTVATNDTRRDIADTTSADRRYGVDTRAAVSSGNSQRRDATVRRGQDLNDEHFWTNNDVNWSKLLMGDATARRGQDITSQTSRRGQDIGSETARRGQDFTHEDRQDAIDAGSDSRAMGYAIRAYEDELKRRKQGTSLFGDQTDDTPTFEDWLKTSDDPEIFPSVKKMFSAPGAVAPAVNTPAAPAVRPPVPGARPSRRPAAGPSLEDQARSLVQQIRSLEAAGKDATAQRQQLATLRSQVK